MRKQIDIVKIDHPVMPVDMICVDHKVTIMTGKSGSQSQMLLDDIAVVMTLALRAGVTARDIYEAFEEVDPQNEPVTRQIVRVIYGDNNINVESEEEHYECA